MFYYLVPHLIGRIDAVQIHLNLLLIQVKTDHLDLFSESHRDRHTHIAKPYQRYLLFSTYYFLI